MRKYLKRICFILVLSLMLLPHLALAATIDPGFSVFQDELGLGTRDLRLTIADLIHEAMGLLGIMAVVVILYGGFIWMISGGNDEKVKQAKDTMISGIIGLVIVLTSYSLANFVVSSILQAT